MFTSARAWALAAVTTAYVAWHRELPLRLMAFLHDAQRLELLRTIGSVYQFRHAAFQDHLVAAHKRARAARTTACAARREDSAFAVRPVGPTLLTSGTVGVAELRDVGASS